jgi:hypothetical protein
MFLADKLTSDICSHGSETDRTVAKVGGGGKYGKGGGVRERKASIAFVGRSQRLANDIIGLTARHRSQEEMHLSIA